MDTFFYCLNGIGPTVLCVVAGYIIKKLKILSNDSVPIINKLCFKALLPILLFNNIRGIDFTINFDHQLILFAVIGILFLTTLLWIIVPRICHDNSKTSALIHCLFRSNFLQLGYILGMRLFGDEGTMYTSMLIAFVIPLMNVLGVVVLTHFAPENEDRKLNYKNLMLDVLKNPLIIASVLGFIVSITGLHIPIIFSDTLKNLGGIASTLCLLALGMQFDLSDIHYNLRTTATAIFVKLILIPAVFMALAINMGFAGARLGSLFVLFASPSAVTAYMMSHSMHSDENLAGQIVLLSTAFSAISVFIGTFILKSLGYF